MLTLSGSKKRTPLDIAYSMPLDDALFCSSPWSKKRTFEAGRTPQVGGGFEVGGALIRLGRANLSGHDTTDQD